jgi:hypothetical protein
MDENISTNTPGILFKKQEILLGSIFCLVGFVVAFTSGYFLNSTLQQEQRSQPTTLPQPTQKPLPTTDPEPEEPVATNELSEVGFYMSDTFFLVAKNPKHQTLIAMVTRKDQDDGSVTQTSRVSYFDGDTWTRDVQTQSQEDLSISPNDLVTSWDNSIDSSRVLKERTQGSIRINKNNLTFDTQELINQIPLRSLPEYTKFMAEGDGSLVINGQQVEAHALQTRIYSFNDTQIPRYDPALGITTDWLAFWDEAGNFYHVDATEVAKPSAIYESHQIVVQKAANSTISQLFSVDIQKTPTFNPETYTFNLPSPIATTLDLQRGSIVEKYSGLGATWHTGTIMGTAVKNGEKIEGYGIVEYLHF